MSGTVAEKMKTQVAFVRMASNRCQVVDATRVSAGRKNAEMSAESGHRGNRLRHFSMADSLGLARGSMQAQDEGGRKA